MKRLDAALVALALAAVSPAGADTVPRLEILTGMPGQVLDYGCSYTLTHATRVFELVIADTTGVRTVGLSGDTILALVEVHFEDGQLYHTVQPLPPQSNGGLGFAKTIRLTSPTVVSMTWALAQYCSISIT